MHGIIYILYYTASISIILVWNLIGQDSRACHVEGDILLRHPVMLQSDVIPSNSTL